MGFWFALADTDGSLLAGSETEISPRPTRVEYPTTPAGQLLETQGGQVIQQQPTRDNRRRAWEWVGYPGWFQRYQDLFAQLEPLRSRYRAEAGLSPYVWLKEDETQEFCRITPVSGTSVTRTFPYFKCRVLGVTRELRKDGGLVRYDTTRVEFTVEDPNWNYLS